MTNTASRLRGIKTFEKLVHYLEEELDWPLEEYSFEDLTFEYLPAELGLKEEEAAKVKTIHQLRPLRQDQPWGIFFVEFERKRMPVVVLRRVLSHLVVKKRAAAHQVHMAAWHLDDLLFISAFGDEASDQREIAFAHFHQETGDLPTLRVLGWDGADTPLKLDHVAATLKERLRWPSDPGDADAWRQQWTPAFRHRVGHVIRTADALAERLALLARGIRDAATTLMDHESERGPLRRLHQAFQTALIHDLSEADFADTYAQTITYGLLTAAISRTEMSEGRYGTALVAGNVTDMVPITNPFLREMLQTFIQAGGRRGGIDFDELGIQDVVELLRGDETDLPAVLRDFGNRTRGEDPVMHFYEHFLAAYDKRLKIKRGIFYTPQPVVSYIVRSVHELLQTEFGLEDGLASTVTWGEMAARHPGLIIPDGTDPQSPFVVILDPATGTATFLVEVIDVAHYTMTAKWTRQGLNEAQRHAAWNEYVPKHLLPRLYGYELMMAPYAIAHMKIGLKLYETGYRFGSDELVRVYLTNTLEPASDSDAQLAFAELALALAHEAKAVNAVKRNQHFTIIAGNPPYAGHSANDSPWIAGLLRGTDEEGRSVENYFEVDGHGLNERNPKWLNDDYVKFIRFGQWRIEQTGAGILAFITNHGYLDGSTFCGMRQSLMSAFDVIYVLDLHGSLIRKESCPDDSPDENVFDIQPGVAILFAVKRPAQMRQVLKTAEVRHADSWGLREHKYQWLLGADVQATEWAQLDPQSPFYLFIPQKLHLHAEYNLGWKMTEVMPVNSMGVTTGRDAFATDHSAEELRQRIHVLQGPRTDEQIRAQYGLRDSSSFLLRKARSWSRASEALDAVVPFSYRCFDQKYVIYSSAILARSREEVCRHQIDRDNLTLVTFRAIRELPWLHVFVAGHAVAKEYVSSLDNCFVFPLYLYPAANPRLGLRRRLFDMLDTSGWQPGQDGRAPNLSHQFVTECERRIGLSFASDGRGDLIATFGPEDVLHYAYAVFHSYTYRTRYADFLKRDFPRLPLTSDRELFAWLVALGADLVTLHLLEDDYPAASWNQTGRTSPLQHPITTFVEGVNGTTMGAFSKSTCYQDGKVYLDTSQGKRSSYFDGVPEDVWNFHVGGYQVCYKWLYDRRGKGGEPGRTLAAEDIAHYQRIVVALKETVRLMEEIDEVIEAYGGWPIE